jgi:hypothetical protein
MAAGRGIPSGTARGALGCTSGPADGTPSLQLAPAPTSPPVRASILKSPVKIKIKIREKW